MQGQNLGASGAAANQAQTNGTANGTPAQPKQRVRARRGQATDPHSIAERVQFLLLTLRARVCVCVFIKRVW